MHVTPPQPSAWDVRARDWADIQQHAIAPAARAALAELGPWRGRSLLDIGCGAGIVAQLAAAAGAAVAGLDASASLIAIARQRVPGVAFHIGDMHYLPYPAATFSAALAFNSLQHAADPGRALLEATRVIQPGGTLTIACWEPDPDTDALEYLLDLGGLMPSVPQPPGPHDLATTCTLLDAAGLPPRSPRTVTCPWHYHDLDTALRGLLSTGPATQAIRHSGTAEVTRSLIQTLAHHRQPDGSYHLTATCTYLTVTT